MQLMLLLGALPAIIADARDVRTPSCAAARSRGWVTHPTVVVGSGSLGQIGGRRARAAPGVRSAGHRVRRLADRWTLETLPDPAARRARVS